MELSKNELLTKFKFLSKFQDQLWIEKNSLTRAMPDKELPFLICKLCLQDLLHLMEKYSYGDLVSHKLTTKTRLNQILSLIEYLTEKSIEEKTIESNG